VMDTGAVVLLVCLFVCSFAHSFVFLRACLLFFAF
jgi:hypothetical protein